MLSASNVQTGEETDMSARKPVEAVSDRQLA